MRLRLGILLAWSLGLGACGLFRTEPDAPALALALEAKQEQAGVWLRLGDALRVYEEEGLEEAEAYLKRVGGPTPREEIFLQDLRRVEWPAEQVREHYQQRYQASRDSLSTMLYARTVDEVRAKRRLLEEAKELDPDFLLVRVEILRYEPYRVGDATVLRRLLRLLDRDPGLAEGWRLLRDFGPRYGRPELACTAADLEPWSPHEDPLPARLDQVRTCLEAGRPAKALARLDEYGLEGRDAALLRAFALAELGRAPEAWDLLLAMQRARPDDEVVTFDLGLLARDYLGQPERATAEFERFLSLVERRRAASQPVDEFRVLQAKTWLRAQPPVEAVE